MQGVPPASELCDICTYNPWCCSAAVCLRSHKPHRCCRHVCQNKPCHRLPSSLPKGPSPLQIRVGRYCFADFAPRYHPCLCSCCSAVASGTNATVTCSKAPNATWPPSGFAVTLTATAGSVTGCTNTRVLQTVISVTAPTAVTLIPPVNTALATVCPSDATRVLNYTFSTAPTGVSLSSVTVASILANGGAGPSCSLLASANGELGFDLGQQGGWKLLGQASTGWSHVGCSWLG